MDKSVSIYMDGLERSGNVYLADVLSRSFSHPVISLRTHDLDTLVNYKEPNPFIVPVRDAFDSIASAKVYRNYTYSNKLFGDNNIHNGSYNNIILRHNNYFDFLIKNPKFFIAPFNCFIKNHDELVYKIIKFHENILVLKISENFTPKSILTNMESHLTTNSYSEHLFSPEIGNVPRERSKERDGVERVLLDKYSEEIKQIQDKVDVLYQRYYDIGE
jgi:hypothetical protein